MFIKPDVGTSVRSAIRSASLRSCPAVQSHVKHMFATHGHSRQADLVRQVRFLAGARESRGLRAGVRSALSRIGPDCVTPTQSMHIANLRPHPIAAGGRLRATPGSIAAGAQK